MYFGVIQDTMKAGTLAFQHPQFRNRIWWWKFYQVSYVGGRDYYQPSDLSVEFWYPWLGNSDTGVTPDGTATRPVITRYNSLLFRNAREEEWEFENRRKKAFYYNFVAPVINALVSHATKKSPTRQSHEKEPPQPEPMPGMPGKEMLPNGKSPSMAGTGPEGVDPDDEKTEAPIQDSPPFAAKAALPAKPKKKEKPDELEEFWDAVDEDRQHRIDSFMRAGLRMANVFGIYWCCVDVKDEKGGGDGKPYAYWVSPLDVWDWHTDDEGDIDWLKQYIYTEKARKTFRDDVKPVSRFRIWYKDCVEEYELDDRGAETLLETRPHELGRVPWIPLYSRRTNDYLFPDGIPLVGDLCKVANHVYNLCSLLNEIFANQAFSQLVFPDPSGKLDKIQIGVKRFLGFDSGGQGGKPEYISPDAEQPRVIMEGIGMAIEIARQMAGVGRGRSEGSKEQASAQALELESDDKRSILSEIAGEAEDFERRLALMVLRYKDADIEELPEGAFISYATDFDLRTYQAEIDETLSLDQVGIPAEIKTELVKDLVRKKFEGRPPEELDRLLDACMKVQVEHEQMKQAKLDALKNPGIDKPGASGQGGTRANPFQPKPKGTNEPPT